MKLLRTSLLVLFSFAAGLVVYRMATKPLPSLRLEWPTAAYSVELTTDQAAPVPFAPPASPSINETRVAVPLADDIVLSNVTAFDIKVADSSASIGLAESSPEASRDIAFGVETTPQEGDPGAPGEPQPRDNSTIADPTDAAQETPNPEPAITAIGVDGGVRLQLEDGSAIEAEQIVLERPVDRAVATDKPLPTISPSEEGAVYLLEQNVSYSVTMGQPVLLECASLRIVRASGFDPKVVRLTAESPHVLKVLGINPGRTALRVVLDKQGEATLYATINVVPPPQIGAAATDSTRPAAIESLALAPLAGDTIDVGAPAAGNSLDATHAPPVQEPTLTSDVEPRLTSGDEATPTFDDRAANPEADAEALRGSQYRDGSQASLPEIEPSEAGTVVAVSIGSGLSLAAGESLLVEEENGGRFARVSGFDPKIVRVTARSPHRLLIEGLTAGETVLTIRVPNVYREPLRVSVTVEPSEKQLQAEQVLQDLNVPTSSWRSLGIKEPQVKPGTDGTVHHVAGDSEYAIAKGKSARFEFPMRIVTVDDFDPAVVQVTAETSQRLKVTAHEAGATSIRIQCESDSAEETFVIGIRVDPWDSAHDELADILKDLYPDADIKLVAIRDSILLRGTVSNVAEAKQISEIAEQYAPKVINQLRLKEDSAATRKHMVMLKFADADKVRSLAVGDRVDLIRGREVRDGKAVEFEEKIVAHDAEVEKVHISGSFALLGVRVTPLEAHVLSDTDSRELTVVRKEGSASDADGFPKHNSLSPRSQIEIPQGMRIAVVKNLKADVVRVLSPGQRVDVVQRITVRRVVTEVTDAGKVSREVAETILQQLATGVAVVSVDADAGSVGLVVTAEVAATLADVSADDLTLQPSRDSSPNMPTSSSPPTYNPSEPPTYTPGDAKTYPAEPQAVTQIVVVYDLALDVLEILAPGQRVNLCRQITFDRIIDGRTVKLRAQKVVATEAEVIAVDVPHFAATFAVSRSQADVLANVSGNELQVEFPEVSRSPAHAALAASSSESDESGLHSDIRALHDDVRRLITLLEQRLSQGNHDEHEFSLPAKTFSPEEKTFAPETKTYSADEVPTESKPRPSDEPGGETAPGDDAAPQSEPAPDTLPGKSSSDADVTSGSGALQQPSDKSADGTPAADLDRVWHLVGLKFTPLSADAPQIQHHFVHGGLLVTEVRPKSPLAEAEVQPGDVIVGIDHWETTDLDDLRACLRIMTQERVPNTSLYIIRNDEQKVPELKFRWLDLESPPRDDTPREGVPTADRHDQGFNEQVWQRLGLRVSQLKSDAQQLRGQPYHGGLLIEAVRPDGPANKAGLRVGDALVGLHVWETVSPGNLHYVLNHPEAVESRPVKFYVLRNGEVLFGRVELDAQKQLDRVDAQRAPRGISPQITQAPPLPTLTVDAELVGVHSDAEIDAFYDEHHHRLEQR